MMRRLILFAGALAVRGVIVAGLIGAMVLARCAGKGEGCQE